MDPIGKAEVDVVVDADASLMDRIKTVRDAIQQSRIATSRSSEPAVALTRENPLKAVMIALVSVAFFWTLARALVFSRA